ncbi:FecCD family ABC transporter permease [Micromonospora sp. URMC 105]|uniref:FecCD family ABC transporter permease n=1 Tax=Micromonospora sp. URMC 105 TaxID=3423413 RepID=UPI003F1C8FBD
MRTALRHRAPLPAVLATGAAAVAALLLAHLVAGTVTVTPDRVLAVLGGGDATRAEIIAVDVRLPRAVVGLLVGALLGAAGALLQSLVRNPLASPDLTGVAQGATAAVLCWIVWGPASGGGVLPLVAAAGGLAAAAVVHLVTRRAGADGERLILVGVLVGGVLSSATSIALLFSGERVNTALGWLLGSLELRDWNDLNLLLGYLAPVTVLIVAAVPLAALLHLGPDVTATLGARPARAQALVLLAAVLATAAAVSIAGAVAFIGLVAPHLARRLVGAAPRRTVPVAALLGALLLSGADLAARTFRLQAIPGLADVDTAPFALPVGVFTALLGVPFLLHVIRRRTP